MTSTLQYDHRQKAVLPWLLWVIALGMLVVVAMIPASQRWVQGLLMVLGLVFIGLGFTFGHLRVRDGGSHLMVQFGPLPLVRRRIDYDQIQNFAAERSSLIDGWGVHYHPVKGWIYNIQGFDCVRLDLGEHKFRVGTDDVAGLMELLKQRV